MDHGPTPRSLAADATPAIWNSGSNATDLDMKY